jgi:glycine/D-amino acid oxidase-like deaminating enzyme
MSEPWDVIVVGGGLAGLAAAATVTAGGASAVVLEGHRPGGRARTSDRGGYVFNMGAHALYVAGPGAAVLKSLGVVPVGTAPPLDRYRALRDGRQHALPTGPGSLLRTTLLGRRGKVQLLKVLAGLPRWKPDRLAGTSVAEWLGGQDLRPDVEDVVRALIRISTYSADVDRFGADAAVAQMQSATRGGVLYLDGGWGQLISALGRGVEVRTGTPVRTVTPAAGRVEVTTAGGTLVARRVVVAAGTPAAARALLPADPGWGDLGGPVTAACLDVGVRRVPDPGYVLGVDAPIYGTTQSPPARQAPAGRAVVAVVRYGARSAAEDRPDLEAHLAEIGVAAEDVDVSRFLAAMVVAGTLPLAWRGGLRGRPAGADTGLEGVEVAGDWVGPTGLLSDAALASGRAAGLAALRAVRRAASMVG